MLLTLAVREGVVPKRREESSSVFIQSQCVSEIPDVVVRASEWKSFVNEAYRCYGIPTEEKDSVLRKMNRIRMV